MSILRIAVVGFLLVGTAICFKCRTETGECETGTGGACFIRFSLTTRRCSIGCLPTEAVPTIDLEKKAPCEWTSEHVQCACFTEGCNMNTSTTYRLPESLQYCIEEFQDSSEETYDYSHGSWSALSQEDLSRKGLYESFEESSSSEEEVEIVHVHPERDGNSTEEVISEKIAMQNETMLRAKRNVVKSSDQSSSEGSGEGSGNSDDEYDDDDGHLNSWGSDEYLDSNSTSTENDANSDETVTSTLSEGDDVVEHKENENGLDSNEESEEHIVEIPSPESVDGLNQTVQSETQESDKQVPSTLVELPESPKPEETNSNNVDFDPRVLPLPLLIPQSGSLSSLVTAGIVTIVNFVIFAQ